jgi:hypothetical protein
MTQLTEREKALEMLMRETSDWTGDLLDAIVQDETYAYEIEWGNTAGDTEVFELYLISEHLYLILLELGEPVAYAEKYGIYLWGRTVTGESFEAQTGLLDRIVDLWNAWTA